MSRPNPIKRAQRIARKPRVLTEAQLAREKYGHSEAVVRPNIRVEPAQPAVRAFKLAGLYCPDENCSTLLDEAFARPLEPDVLETKCPGCAKLWKISPVTEA